MADFRSITVKPVAAASPNGAVAPGTVEKAMAALEKATTPPPAVETKPAEGEAVKAPDKDEKFNRALAQESKIRREREAIEAEKAALDRRAKELDARGLKPEAYRADPRKILEDAFPGLPPTESYRLLTEAILSDGQPAPELAVAGVKQELESLRTQVEKEREDRAKADEDRQQREQEQAIRDIQDEIGEHLEASKAAYPFLLAALEDEADATGTKVPAKKYVFDVIEAAYKADQASDEVKDGLREAKILSYEEAAKKCEAFHRAKYDKLSKLAGTPAAPPPRQAAPSLAGAPQASPGVALKRRTMAERIAAAEASIPDN